MKKHLLFGFILIISLLSFGQKHNNETKQKNMLLKCINNFIEKKLPGKELVRHTIFSDEVQKRDNINTFYEADFDNNRYLDWALMLIDKKTQNIEIYFILNPYFEYKIILLETIKEKNVELEMALGFYIALKPKGQDTYTPFYYQFLEKDNEQEKVGKIRKEIESVNGLHINFVAYTVLSYFLKGKLIKKEMGI